MPTFKYTGSLLGKEKKKKSIFAFTSFRLSARLNTFIHGVPSLSNMKTLKKTDKKTKTKTTQIGYSKCFTKPRHYIPPFHFVNSTKRRGKKLILTKSEIRGEINYFCYEKRRHSSLLSMSNEILWSKKQHSMKFKLNSILCWLTVSCQSSWNLLFEDIASLLYTVHFHHTTSKTLHCFD